jgi:hypothetical protein
MPEPHESVAKILVVDDNEQNRALAEATLEDEGHEVILASSGETRARKGRRSGEGGGGEPEHRTFRPVRRRGVAVRGVRGRGLAGAVLDEQGLELGEPREDGFIRRSHVDLRVQAL